MVTKIGIAAAVALVASLASSNASLAARKNYRDVSQCLGGACTAVNPDRVPNQSAQFYRSNHKSGKKPKSHTQSN